MRLALAAALAPLVAAVLLGCGREPADLMVVTRSGDIPGARLTMLVTDGGEVSCNGGELQRMDDELLLDARGLVRDLGPEAQDGLALPPRRGSQLRYRVRMEEGTIAFADNAIGGRRELAELQLLVRALARDVCGLPR
jgi:hypothetical protein